MATQAQIDAARANGAKSHGPVTEEGKAKSSQNALRHGAFASIVLLVSESPILFDSLTEDFIQTFQPANAVETKIVERLVAASWREQRAMHLEKEIVNLKMQEQLPEIAAKFKEITHATRTAIAYGGACNIDKTLASLQSAISESGRQFGRALRDLEKVRKIVAAQPQPEIANVRNEPKSTPEAPKPGNEPAHPVPAPKLTLVKPAVPAPESGNEPNSAPETDSSPYRPIQIPLNPNDAR